MKTMIQEWQLQILNGVFRNLDQHVTCDGHDTGLALALFVPEVSYIFRSQSPPALLTCETIVPCAIFWISGFITCIFFE